MSKHLAWLWVSACLWLTHCGLAQVPQRDWELGPTGTRVSLRGISAPSATDVWACGAAATVIRSSDGGASWQNCSPTGLAALELRSIHAWDGQRACVASAGTPAIILRTADGGQSWQEAYRHPSADAFFDGLRFWDAERGLAFSDPIDGEWLLVDSQDGGLNWTPVAPQLIPAALAGEAGFAASNSAMCLGADGAVWIGTGGTDRSTSRIYRRQGWDRPWEVSDCPLISGPASGVFSIAGDEQLLVAVGGDYRPDQISPTTAAWSRDAGRSWQLAHPAPASFRSAAVALPSGAAGESTTGVAGFVAVGPSGSDFSPDGRQWSAFSDHGFHALAVTPAWLFGVGADGRFGRLACPGLATSLRPPP